MTIKLEDIEAAAARIDGHAVRTPLIQSAELDALMSAEILIKPENLQRSGSFKFRGAFNRLKKLDDPARAGGVVAWSSGNHAQGVAAAAQLLDIHAAIVMPSDAPHIKLDKTRGFGAEVVLYDRYTRSREEIAAKLAEERGAVLVPSFDDLDIIAGQGTCGLEFYNQCKERGVKLDTLFICCGGGGLTAGMATAFKACSPAIEIFCVEPEDFNDHERSLKSGQIEKNAPDARSICDALLAPQPGALTFPINKRLLAGGVSVSDTEVLHAMAYAFSTLKLVVEPGGAVALAAVLFRKIPVEGRKIGVVISGGNVDPALFAKAIATKI
ncbi:MAG: threonine/serine dehydratase [Pseudomonadota bacterium]